jgi:hypothetical protein
MKRIIKELLTASSRIEPIGKSEEEVFKANYTNLQRYHPGVGVFDMPAKDTTMPSMWHIVDWKSGNLPVCKVDICNNEGATVDAKAYVKITHILNPMLYLKGEYCAPGEHQFLPVASDAWMETVHKLNSPNNQAYVDAACAYVVSRFRELDLMPHFPLYYGSMTGIAKKYKYNISDDFESYRNCRWFWRGIKALGCGLEMDSEDPDIVGLVLSCPYSEDELAREDTDGGSVATEVLAGSGSADEIGSLHSADDLPDIETTSGCSSSDAETEELEPDISILIPNMPVTFIYQEAHEGTMDALIDLEAENSTAKSKDDRWLAWILQIVAALAFLQRTIGFTHNDLHTNNIVWRSTTQKFLYYRSSKGTIWRVPTFGKIFSIIDYGRAIFHVGNKYWLSDNFESCEDAAGQYNFGPIYDRSEPKITPNYSFDLCRLAISILDGLYPDSYPKSVDGGAIISDDGEGWIIRETKSHLFNILWQWTVDTHGASVYERADGEERYPGFELYVRIAADCRQAVPRVQLEHAAFQKFVFTEKVPKGQKVYHIV